MLSLIFLFLISFLICFILTFFLKFIFSKINYFYSINLVKKKEGRFIPLTGGIGIYLCFLLVTLIYFNLYYKTVKGAGVLYGIVIGAGIILLIGFLDDIFEFSPLIKLAGQILVAIGVVLFGISTEIIYVPYSINLVITILWIVGIVNAFNLLDILDGLAPGIGLIASLVFFILSLYTGNFMIGWICLILGGSLLAFLIFNFPPAKIYLGDMGSMLLGFVLSIIALEISYAPQNHEFALIAPILILGLPIYDLGFVTLRRLFRKKSIFNKTDDHFAFQLLKQGYTQKKTLYIMYSLCLLFGITSIAITWFENRISIFIFVVFVVIFWGINKFLFRNRNVLSKF